MKLKLTQFAGRLSLALTLLAVLCAVRPASAAGLQDFGFNRFQATGQRPLLIILVSYAGGPAFQKDKGFYDSLVFNFLQQPSVNGYYLNNSNGRFLWVRAGDGIIGPLSLPAATATLPPEQRLAAAKAAAVGAGFDFGQFDANRDGQVTTDELGIITIENLGDNDSGAERTTSPPCVPYTQLTFPFSLGSLCSNGSQLVQKSSLMTICHEMSHQLGTIDLYGAHALNQNLTLMDATLSGTPYDRQSYHLDPWHKMQLGWSEPRIRSLGTSGSEVLPAANLVRADAPVILYDPNRGTSEYFILEYRSPSNAGGSPYDKDVGGSGLALWHVQQDGNNAPTLIPDQSAGLIPGQPNWLACRKCQGLFFGGNSAATVCPAGGSHDGSGSSNLAMVWNAPAAPGGPRQPNWRWCVKCQGLFFGGNSAATVCPAGGSHDGTQSSNYSLVYETATAPGQANWRWCGKCQGLYYAGGATPTVCPAGGAHAGSISYNYTMVQSHYAVFHEGAPGFCWGGSSLWKGGDVTPALRWLDGSSTQTSITVRPFAPGASSITVDWTVGAATVQPGQPDWRWCRKCKGLFYGGSPSPGSCPAGGAHDGSQSGNYSLMHDSPGAPGQSSWRWCGKCQGLYFAGNGTQGTCPAGGAHGGTPSFNYQLVGNSPTAPGQSNWRWCRKCQGLFYGGSPATSCPKGGAHDGSQSGDYSLVTCP